jgi:DNA-binding SARP family transcriptional activator/predicted ATPase/tetratricopeptide (TPR) repeat protein
MASKQQMFMTKENYREHTVVNVQRRFFFTNQIVNCYIVRMGSLKLGVLGPFEAALDGRSLGRFRTKTVPALLVYLACQPETVHRREHLMTLLWPGLPQKSAQANLRQTLYLLRQAIPTVNETKEGEQVPLLLADRQTVQVNPDATYDLDLLVFEKRINEGDAGREAAVALYRGDFLCDFYLPDSAAFEEWTLARREELRRMALEALESLAGEAMSAGAYQTAAAYAHRQIALDGLRESAHGQLMEALARDGRRSEALAVYESLVEKLFEELAMEPSPQTDSLAEIIRENQLEDQVKTITLVRRDEGRELPRHNLPADRTPFIGREQELDELADLLNDPGMRLVTIVGPGGMGKTRLAQTLAAMQLRARDEGPDQTSFYRYPDGVFFVSLEDLVTEDQLIMAIMASLELKSDRLIEPKAQLLAYLKRKRLLLVLDNFEQLLEAVGFLGEMVEAAPSVQLLVTTRENLSVHGEQLYPIVGMVYPESLDIGEEHLETFSAVRLFIQSARRMRPDFELLPEFRQHVAEICRRLGGMPLALELAAGWVKMLSLREISEEVKNSLEILGTEFRDIPDRHRSISAMFERTWSKLGESEQQLFIHLSIFRGGFTREAAKEVTGASLYLLSNLSKKSLVQFNFPVTRYQIHPLLRQFGKSLLAQDPVAANELRYRHCKYYCEATEKWDKALHSRDHKIALSEMEFDYQNVRLAWDWAVKNRFIDEIDLAYIGLMNFYTYSGRASEEEKTYWEAHKVLSEDETANGRRMLAKVLATFAGDLSYEINLNNFGRSLKILDELESQGFSVQSEKAHALRGMGWLNFSIGEMQQAYDSLAECLDLYIELDDWWCTALVHSILAIVNRLQGLFEQAIQNASECLHYYDLVGHEAGKGLALTRLAEIYRAQGRFDEAQKILEDEAQILLKDDMSFYKYLWYYLALGFTYLIQGDYERAKMIIGEGYSMAAEAGDHFKNIMSFYIQFVNTYTGNYESIEYSTGNEISLLDVYPVATHYILLRKSWELIYNDQLAEAVECLERCVAWNSQANNREDGTLANAWLSVAYHYQGNIIEAIQQLQRAFSIAVEIGCIYPVIEGLPVAALLLTDLGQHERAVEVYEVALQFPHVANARLFEDLIGKEIKVVEAELPPQVVEEAKSRGRELDPWETMEELHQELGELVVELAE